MDREYETLDIHLDRSLQVWVLLPITIVTILMNLLRRNLSRLLLREPTTTLLKIRDANCLCRAQKLRRNGGVISPAQFEARRQFFSEQSGALHKTTTSRSRSNLPAIMNPENLSNQVLSMVISVVPHMIIGTWARDTFARVAVCKLPFSLTPRFRPMLQSGLELGAQNLDVSYVSAPSWYVLNLFGNAGVLSLWTDGPGSTEVFVPNALSQMSTTMDLEKAFSQEREAIIKTSQPCLLDTFEHELIKTEAVKYGTY